LCPCFALIDQGHSEKCYCLLNIIQAYLSVSKPNLSHQMLRTPSQKCYRQITLSSDVGGAGVIQTEPQL